MFAIQEIALAYWNPVSTIVQADSSIMEIVESAGNFGNAFAERDSDKWMATHLDMENEK